jgi:hypothetical protein
VGGKVVVRIVGTTVGDVGAIVGADVATLGTSVGSVGDRVGGADMGTKDVGSAEGTGVAGGAEGTGVVSGKSHNLVTSSKMAPVAGLMQFRLSSGASFAVRTKHAPAGLALSRQVTVKMLSPGLARILRHCDRLASVVLEQTRG